MGDTPRKQLDPKIKNVWRASDAIGITLIFLCCVLPFAIGAAIEPAAWVFVVLGVLVAAYVAALVVACVICPPIRYARWRYKLSENYLDIERGIIWRKHFVIPFIRVQNTDTSQGPILRMFGLSSVTVSTAASEHVIPGLDQNEAEQLRDRAAEFARLAREDV